MTVQWSSGTDLHLELDPEQPRSGPALAEALRGAIRAGRLAAGQSVPSTRALAADLGIARGTVTRVYEQLRIEGFLQSRQGAATTVAARVPVPDPAGAGRSAVVPTTLRWSLEPGLPDVSAFPRLDWLAAGRRALAELPADALGHGSDPLGQPRLRAVLADYLGRTRGVLADPSRTVICAGYAHGLSLLAQLLAQRGPFGFEDPSLQLHRRIVTGAGVRVVGLPVDRDGAQVSGSAAGVVVVTPAHQYPLGHTLSPERRAALAAGGPAVVIEDDYDGEFRYDRRPVGALQALAPDRVVYAGTSSKTLAPGLRLGWLVLPPSLVGPMSALLRRAESRVSVLDQLTLAELIRSGGYDRQVRRMRAVYRARRDRVLELVRRRGDPVTVAGIAAGLHLVLRLPPGGPTEAELRATCARHDLAVQTLDRHWLPGSPEPRPTGLIIGYGAPAGHAFGPALRALDRSLTDLF
ncbi:PLP-dependent aminotransferase family protein [Microlunatus speluncae]|uniref:MocR-like pyridoxine biosynthesis transcription factor PdxR n=1 Tax=Microlunatus speluncae TaxID=2594267 RepID=UPI001266761E|nr:PLP-dependent aminotransferase family protein [Microlunatus speluncae]